MASIPLALWWAPLDAAESPEKRATIPVAAIYQEMSLLCTRWWRLWNRTYHAELAANLVRDPTEDKHTNDSARKGHAGQCLAIIIVLDSLGI
jgi:hypothetical protein